MTNRGTQYPYWQTIFRNSDKPPRKDYNTVTSSGASFFNRPVAGLFDRLSQFATRHGNLVSAKARLELKAVDAATGPVLAVDRQVAVEVDLTEQVAGKAALQEAAAEIAGRLLPKIVTSVKGKKEG